MLVQIIMMKAYLMKMKRESQQVVARVQIQRFLDIN